MFPFHRDSRPLYDFITKIISYFCIKPTTTIETQLSIATLPDPEGTYIAITCSKVHIFIQVLSEHKPCVRHCTEVNKIL